MIEAGPCRERLRYAHSARRQMIPAQDATTPTILMRRLLRYAGWRVVLACFLMALFLFGFALYGQGIYLVELQRLNGWPPALISGASTLSFLLGNMLATFTSEFVDPAGREAARPARNCGACGVDGAARVGDRAVAALCRLHPDVARMDRHGNGRDRDRREPVVRAPSRARHQPCLHRREFRRGRHYARCWCFSSNSSALQAAMLTAAAIMVAVLVPVALAWIGPPSRPAVRRMTGGRSLDRNLKSPRRNGEISRVKLMRQPGVLDDLASLCTCSGGPDRLHRAPDRAA